MEQPTDTYIVITDKPRIPLDNSAMVPTFRSVSLIFVDMMKIFDILTQD